MIDKFRNIFQNKSIKDLITNFVSLTVLQALNVFLPYLTIPYLIKIVGISNYGLLSYANALAFFFMVVVEYGFNNITTRDISINSDNKKEIERIYSEVLSSKILLLLICSILYVLVVFSFDKLKEDYLIYLLYFGIIIGQALFPLWLFQGLQKMKYITYINVFFKSVFTICIFLFVKGESTMYLVPLFISSGFILSGITALILAKRLFEIQFKIAQISSVIQQLKGSYSLFMSEVYIVLVANVNILILGSFAGNTATGIYSAAEKIIRAIGNIQSPIINTFFPFISKIINENSKKAIPVIKKIQNFGVLFFLGLIVVLYFSAEFIFNLIINTGDVQNVTDSVSVFKIMLLFPLFSFLDQVYGKLVLLTTNQEKKFYRVFLVCSVVNVLLCCVLSYKYSYFGTALANVIVQLLIVLGMFYYARPILYNKSFKR